MPQDNNNPQAAQPVPKEGATGDATIGQSVPADTTQPSVPLAGPSPAGEGQAAPVPKQTGSTPQAQQAPSQTPPPQTPPPQQVVVKERGGKGMCNTTTCCIGSCIGCLAIIVILVLLGIFAAPTLSNLLNKALNPGVNVPEVKDVSTESLESTLAQIPMQDQEQTLEISEDEFNALLKKRYSANQEGELSLDIRADFESETATLYMKLAQWMPWAVIQIVNDETGQLETRSVKFGPLDVSSFAKDTIQQKLEDTEEITSSTTSLNFTSLFASILFEDNANQISIKEVYFYKDKVTLLVEPSTSVPSELEE